MCRKGQEIFSKQNLLIIPNNIEVSCKMIAKEGAIATCTPNRNLWSWEVVPPERTSDYASLKHYLVGFYSLERNWQFCWHQGAGGPFLQSDAGKLHGSFCIYLTYGNGAIDNSQKSQLLFAEKLTYTDPIESIFCGGRLSRTISRIVLSAGLRPVWFDVGPVACGSHNSLQSSSWQEYHVH